MALHSSHRALSFPFFSNKYVYKHSQRLLVSRPSRGPAWRREPTRWGVPTAAPTAKFASATLTFATATTPPASSCPPALTTSTICQSTWTWTRPTLLTPATFPTFSNPPLVRPVRRSKSLVRFQRPTALPSSTTENRVFDFCFSSMQDLILTKTQLCSSGKPNKHSKHIHTRVIDDRLKIIDDVPNSAVEMVIKDKVRHRRTLGDRKCFILSSSFVA